MWYGRGAQDKISLGHLDLPRVVRGRCDVDVSPATAGYLS